MTKLGNLGNRIEGLDFNSGIFFGNVETCSDATTCIGTNNDEIIYGGVREQVFGLKGEDMIFGSLDSQLYGQQGDDSDWLLPVITWRTEVMAIIQC